MCLIAFSNEEQKATFLPKVASGEIALALAFSETGTGTHFYNPEISVQKVDGGYKLNGKKSFVTSALNADYYLLLTANPVSEGLDVFIVDRNLKGVRHEESAWDGLGMRGNASMPVYFEDVFVDESALVGSHGDGAAIVFNVVAPFFILGLAAVYSGLGLASANTAIAYAQERTYTNGAKLSEIETVQLHIAKLYTLSTSSKHFTLAAAKAAANGDADALAQVISSRVHASNNTLEVCSIAMKVGGGNAYAKRLPLERYLRDAYAAAVMAPSTDVLSVWLGKALTGQQIP
jgi:alkylation response protein AidB-like acyl-CoA dehydrogenase